MQTAEAAEKYHITQDTRRYYERIGLIPRVNRNRGGIRYYTDEDERWVEFIAGMRARGFPSRYSSSKGACWPAKIDELQKTLKRLDGKITRDDQVPLEKERQMSGFSDEPEVD